MITSFKEYSFSDQSSQLICLIRCADGVVPENIYLLKKVNNCQLVVPISVNQVVMVFDDNVGIDIILAEIEDVLETLPFEAMIEETRLGCFSESEPIKTILSDRFSIVPPGTDESKSCEDIIFLENANIFGSGHHPSTRLTVKALEAIAFDGGFPAEVLDVGCGSGILSIVCSRLGAKRVVGIDICHESIHVARKNAVNNCIDDLVHFSCNTLSEVVEQFDLIVANISPSVLHELIGGFKQRLAASGMVVLSGLHTGQVEGIVRQMSDISCELQSSYLEGSWRSLSFQRS